MSLYKRNKTYHTDFSVHGQRFRVSLDTTDWRAAQAKEKELVAQATEGKLNPKSHLFGKVGFTDAAELHTRDRKDLLAPRSIQTEKERLKPLAQFFQQTALRRISGDMLREYVSERKKAGIANKTVNLEIGVVRSLLKRAKRWHLLEGEIKPLPVNHQVGRALRPLEESWLQKIAAADPGWERARIAMTIALNTTMRSCELKGLRWQDVDFAKKIITITKSKTHAGERVIPLNRGAWAAIMQLFQTAKQNGTVERGHFLFPACENGNIDPTKPQRSWRSAWRSLTRAVECPACGQVQKPGKVCRKAKCNADIHDLKSPIERLRFHDLRHHAITALAESQASDQTIMAISGHVSREMLDHYSHIRLEAKRLAVEALSHSVPQRSGYVTNNVTNEPGRLEAPVLTETKHWSGREDLNLRPPGPEPGALPG